MDFDLGVDGGTFTMTGTASEGKKTVVSGGVVANGTALGSSGETWLVQEKGFLAVDASANPSAVINRIDANSNGILALTSDTGGLLDLSGHTQLIIGAYGPDEIHYGSTGTELATVDHEWHLGGAGGTLVVDSALKDTDGTLVLGNDFATGTVRLTNQENNIGTIRIQGAGNLEYEGNALGQSSIQAGYAARIGGGELGNRIVGEGSQGVRLLEDSSTMDMTSFGEMAVGTAGDATLSGLDVQLAGSTLLTEDLPVWMEYVDASGTLQRMEGYYTVEAAETAALAEASAAQHDHVYFRIAGAVVPEPATSTLSLLALVGLMARRRRK